MNEDIIARVKQLADEKGEKPTTSMKAAGLGVNFFVHLRNGAKPSIDKIQKLAEYFSVTTDYILGIENDTGATKKEPAPYEGLTHDLINILIEKGIIKEGVPLSPEGQKRLLDCFDVATDAYKKFKH